MERTVLLRHEVAEGAGHFDWLIERPDGGRLIAFRVRERIDEGARAWEGERIADHREAYLEFEGEVSGGRGRVTRVAAGVCRVVEEGETRLVVDVKLGALVGRVVGTAQHGRWRFELVTLGN